MVIMFSWKTDSFFFLMGGATFEFIKTQWVKDDASQYWPQLESYLGFLCFLYSYTKWHSELSKL